MKIKNVHYCTFFYLDYLDQVEILIPLPTIKNVVVLSADIEKKMKKISKNHLFLAKNSSVENSYYIYLYTFIVSFISFTTKYHLYIKDNLDNIATKIMVYSHKNNGHIATKIMVIATQ